ncbi:urate hydroxylase PuuD [Polymorphobacter sp.]|uniref:urate hydroxylase PuuD n=1 Tax=Polymorphobacter sp. TaxID=1909290 RepID=UPI003F72B417
MANILGNLNRASLIGGVLLLLTIAIFHGGILDINWVNALLRFAHVLVGIAWIGLLYYFNLVQIPTMPKVPAELKPGVTKYIAPEALFWFRWAALATMLIGLAIAGAPQQAYLVQALTFQPGVALIGLGMWLGIIMAANVWMFIWPAQKIALGIVDGTAEEKAAAGRKAMMFSRTNFVLSFPMLYCMVTRGVIG